MRKLTFTLLVLLALFLPCCAMAATISGSLTQISARSTRELEKIAITLESAEGGSVQATTDKDGRYRFTSVTPGRYRITVDLPSDHVPALMGDDNWLLPGQDRHAQTDWFQVEGNMEINLASTRATVFVKVIGFIDENMNGGRMNSEPALQGAEVSLHPAGHPEVVVASGVTDRKGELTLNTLSPGNYQVRVVFPEHYSAGPLGSKFSQYYNCIAPSDTQEAWSESFLLTTGSQGVGIGAVTTGGLQGHIWFDADANGKQEKQEGGLEGVRVTLTAQDSGLSRTAVTGPDGDYSFSRLQPGDYTVQVTVPSGYMFAAGDNWLTDDYSDTAQGTVTVAAEDELRVRAVGAMRATGLRVVFYHDTNANGMMDGQETGTAGATITVYRNGRAVGQATSDERGFATIPILRAGDYQVTAALSDPYIFSPTGFDNDFALSVADTQSSADTALTPGETTTLYAAMTLPAQVGGTLFMDADNDGLRAAADAPVEGFTVQAVDWNGQVAATTVTDAAGAYLFDRLLPIPHTIRFLLKDPYIAAPYAASADPQANSIVSQNADYGETAQLSLTPGSFTGNINGALFQAGTISGRVLLTDDRPAGMGAGLEGVTVTLTTLDGEEVSDYTTAQSEADGSYYLKGILPGEYKLRYSLPQDSLFAETDDPVIYSVPFTSALGTDTQMEDVYAVRTAVIEGQVLCEGAPADAVIQAVNTDTGYTVTFPAESVSAGYFALRLLRPGTWNVTVTLGEGYSFAEDTDLVPAIADHVSSQEYTLEMGQTLSGQQIQVTKPAVVAGRLFLDENLSGAFDADAALPEAVFEGLQIALMNRDGDTVAELTTDAEGCFESPLLIPGKYQVALTLDSDCILLEGYQLSREEWAQDVTAVAGERTDIAVPVLRFASIGGRLWSLDDSLDFVSGLEVRLYDAQDTAAPISVTKTDAQGLYQFPRLYPGEYRLTVALPEGHGFARRADTSETRVSLVVSNDGENMSDPLQLRMGVKITNADFGFGAKGSIGDFAWLDENGNGMQDIGEPGIPGITIQLMQEDELLAETETDVYGHYMFEGVYPGHYTLRVTMHKELKSTLHQTEFPLIGSVLPESDERTVDAHDVVVPSGTRNLAVDLGFRLRKEGVYPAVMDTIPTTDWSFGGRKR